MTKNRKKFIVRNENFGLIVYDKDELKPIFLNKKESAKFLSVNDVDIIDNLPFTERRDIIYSPIRVFFETTLACNLKCKTCFNNSRLPLREELSLEESIKVIEGLKKNHIFDIKFTGGEPTQKQGWEILLERAKDLGLVITLNSNGIYTPYQIDRLIKINPNEISISIDGYGESNDIIRGKGSFNKSIDSIRKLKGGGCRVTINSLITPFLEENDIRNLLAFANDYCDDISFFHIRPIGRATNIKDKLLGYEALNQFMEKIEEMKKDYPNLKIRTRSSSLRDNSLRKQQIKELELEEGGSDGFTRFNISSNGDLYAGGCVPYVNPKLKKEMILGNIVTEGYSLLNIWRFSNKLDNIRKWSSQLQKRCNLCEDYEVKCQGFTLEMELYGKTNLDGNIYCKKKDIFK